MDWTLLTTQLLNGLQLGLLLFLLASGLTLIFGIMDFINLSHGSFYMMGAYFSGSAVIHSGSFLLGILFGIGGMLVVGALIELLIARQLYRRDHLDHILVTFGLILIFDALVHIIWGANGMAISLPAMLNGQITLGALELPIYRLLIISSGLLVAALLYFFIHKTRLGMLIRAGASNRTMVEALGINIDRLYLFVFALGAAMAGFAGMLIAPITGASIGMGNDIIILAFVVVIVGGVGSIKGAFYAALILGLMDTLSRSYLDDLLKLIMNNEAAETAAPAISAMLIYILMAGVLAFKPQGLFPPTGNHVRSKA